jgi:integrase
LVEKKARYRLVYDRKKKAKATGKGLIEIYVYHNPKQKKYISTKIWVHPSEWDTSRQLVNSKNDKYIAYNLNLKTSINDIETYELKQLNTGKPFTMDKLGQHIAAKGNELTFTAFWHNTLTKDMSLQPASKRPQRRALELLKAHAGTVKFSDINYQLINTFDTYLRGEGYATGTIWRVHKDVKKYINLAINYDYLDVSKYPYRKFKVVKDPQKHIYLNYTELAQIEEADLSGVPSIEIIRDMFLFQCYTGLRYSDVHRLNAADFEQRPEGLTLILTRMYKVNRRLFLRLWDMFDGKPQRLIKKYIEVTPPPKYLFGRYVGNSELNGALLIIKDKLGVRKKITTHVGRHTFGTLYAKQTGSIFDVMKAMGISKFETAQIYIDLSEEL